MRRGSVLALAALLSLLGAASPGQACKWCGYVPTLREEMARAPLVCQVTLSNPYQNADEQPARMGGISPLRPGDLLRIQPLGAMKKAGDEETILYVGTTLKSVPLLRNTKILRVALKLPPDARGFVVFCDLWKGKLDPYRGLPIKSADLIPYLRGAMALPPGPSEQGLRYFLDYLSNKDEEIATDAFKELASLDPEVLRRFARTLPADRIARRLEDPSTPVFHYGVYASLLGYCGTARHAAVLRKLLDDLIRREQPGRDSMLAAYTMLKPKDGWAYLSGIIKDPSKDFNLRYGALRAIRFFWESEPFIIPRKDLLAGIDPLLDQGDIADLPIEDLRRWGRWELTERVLKLHGKKSHDVPVVRRAILRFAMTSPYFNAAEFVAEKRRQDPAAVADMEELLALERN
jgi:hypothetical protein